MTTVPVARGVSSSGFTLIEVLVAITLLAIVFIEGFILFKQTVRTEETTRFYTVAPMLAQSKMVEAVTGLSGGRFYSSGEFEHYPGYRWQITVTEAAAGLSESAVDGMKRIDVLVTGIEEYYRFQLRRYELPI